MTYHPNKLASRFMKRICGAMLVVAALVAGSPGRAQDPILDACSREVVVINSEAAAEITNASSRESVLINSELVAMPVQTFSRESTVINSETTIVLQAVSREAVLVASELQPLFTQSFSNEAVLVNSESPVVTQAHSKEAVLVVSESPIVDTFSREIAVYDGYYTWEAMDALRIAGGIQNATAENMSRFALALQLTNSSRINLPVAVRILRIATRLQP